MRREKKPPTDGGDKKTDSVEKKKGIRPNHEMRGPRTICRGLKFDIPAKPFSSIRYTKDHEWVRYKGPEDDMFMGISHYAQSQLGDVVFLDFQVKVGDHVKEGEIVAAVESVKAAGDVYMPIEGEILEVNAAVDGASDGSDPSIINSSPEDAGWFIRFRAFHPQDVVDKLMEAGLYERQIQEKKD